MKRKSWQKKTSTQNKQREKGEKEKEKGGERESAEKRKADRQRRNWRPQMKGEIGLVFACEFPHRKSTSCHRGSMNGGARRSSSSQGREGGRQQREVGKQTAGRRLASFPLQLTHTLRVCVCVCGSRECRVWVEVVPGRREEGGEATVGRQH